MRASVLIPSYRSASTIRRCLASVCAQQFTGEYEVILADSSDDGTVDIARREFPRVQVLHAGERLDAEQARNWAAREARGALFAFIDSDCEADPDWLTRMCVALEPGAHNGVGGAIRPFDGETAIGWAGYFCEFREFLPGEQVEGATYLTPNNAAYTRELFERAGGFPVGYFPLEDQVFYRRLAAAGASIVLDRRIAVRHTHRRTLGAFFHHQQLIGLANARVALDLGVRGEGLAKRPWLLAVALPALTTYRLARTVLACWRQERWLLVRRPVVVLLCWLGMWGWGLGFLAGARRGAAER